MSYTKEELERKTMAELYRLARDIELAGYSRLRKGELIYEIQKATAMKEEQGQLMAGGILDIMPDGYGFLRPLGYLPSYDDIDRKSVV